MPYVTSIERIGRARGRKEGRNLGLKEGRQEGREEGLHVGRKEGREEASRDLVARLLAKRFGPLSPATEKAIEGLSLQKLEALGVALLDFQSKGDLQAWLQAASR